MEFRNIKSIDELIIKSIKKASWEFFGSDEELKNYVNSINSGDDLKQVFEDYLTAMEFITEDMKDNPQAQSELSLKLSKMHSEVAKKMVELGLAENTESARYDFSREIAYSLQKGNTYIYNGNKYELFKNNADTYYLVLKILYYSTKEYNEKDINKDVIDYMSHFKNTSEYLIVSEIESLIGQKLNITYTKTGSFHEIMIYIKAEISPIYVEKVIRFLEGLQYAQ